MIGVLLMKKILQKKKENYWIEFNISLKKGNKYQIGYKSKKLKKLKNSSMSQSNQTYS